jgi:hypothetical protein
MSRKQQKGQDDISNRQTAWFWTFDGNPDQIDGIYSNRASPRVYGSEKIHVTHLPETLENNRIPRMNLDSLLEVHLRKLQPPRSKETYPKTIPVQGDKIGYEAKRGYDERRARRRRRRSQ